MSHMFNVILTTPELGGVGFLTSNISQYWNYMHPGPFKLRWRLESSYFEATRKRRPLPEGYVHCWNGDPQTLLDRGFDKVMVLQKTLPDSYLGMSIYFYAHEVIDNIAKIHPNFYEIIKRKWDAMEKYRNLKDERFLFIDFEDVNNHTVKTFNEIFDFLEFEKEGRPFIMPIKVWRNWECYSNIEKSGNEWFEFRDPLFHIRKQFSRRAMIKDFFYDDLKLEGLDLKEVMLNYENCF